VRHALLLHDAGSSCLAFGSGRGGGAEAERMRILWPQPVCTMLRSRRKYWHYQQPSFMDTNRRQRREKKGEQEKPSRSCVSPATRKGLRATGRTNRNSCNGRAPSTSLYKHVVHTKKWYIDIFIQQLSTTLLKSYFVPLLICIIEALKAQITFFFISTSIFAHKSVSKRILPLEYV